MTGVAPADATVEPALEPTPRGDAVAPEEVAAPAAPAPAPGTLIAPAPPVEGAAGSGAGVTQEGRDDAGTDMVVDDGGLQAGQ